MERGVGSFIMLAIDSFDTNIFNFNQTRFSQIIL